METSPPTHVAAKPAGTPRHELSLPKLTELGVDLLHITKFQQITTLTLPFLCVGVYFVFAFFGYWPLAVLTLMYLSFITYGSISHDLVHQNLGLSRRANAIFLSLIELLTIRSGHAYRMVHLHHHKRFPHDDDIEGAASKMTFFGSLVEGTTLQLRIYIWALRRTKQERGWVVFEGIGCLTIIMGALLVYPVTVAPLIYVVLMIMGSWIIPLITSYIPHDPNGKNMLYQTRLFRGVVASVIAMEHLYHLEHHLYPAVPHHNWPHLAKRLDPYFEEMGVKPIKIWF
jgi:beta-carotene hydroxylase